MVGEVTDSLPDGYTRRALVMDEAEAVNELINACALAAIGERSSTVETVRAQWSDPARNLADEDWVVVAPDGSLAGFLELYEYEPWDVFEFDGYVYPAHAGRGIGSTLLKTIGARARRVLQRTACMDRRRRLHVAGSR